MATIATKATWLFMAVGVVVSWASGCSSLSSSDAALLPPFDASALADGGDLTGPVGDASSCQPGNVLTYVPKVYHPAAVVYGSCSTDEIKGYYAACLATDATPQKCTAFAQASAACAACIRTPDTAVQYGPLVSSGTLVRPNVAGCIEIKDAPHLACAKSQQALAGCELVACGANCPVNDTYQGCAASARTSLCRRYADAATCAAAGDAAVAGDASDAGSVTPLAFCTELPFDTFYNAVVPLFCGDPPDGSSNANGAWDAGSEASATFADDASADAAQTPTADAGLAARDGGARDASAPFDAHRADAMSPEGGANGASLDAATDLDGPVDATTDAATE